MTWRMGWRTTASWKESESASRNQIRRVGSTVGDFKGEKKVSGSEALVASDRYGAQKTSLICAADGHPFNAANDPYRLTRMHSTKSRKPTKILRSRRGEKKHEATANSLNTFGQEQTVSAEKMESLRTTARQHRQRPIGKGRR